MSEKGRKGRAMLWLGLTKIGSVLRANFKAIFRVMSELYSSVENFSESDSF
jgi:hypothetical protein